MMRGKLLKLFALVAVGGIPFVTAASCNQFGASFFRDDDGDYYGDDCYYDDCYYDDYYYDDYYYEDVVYVDDYYYGP